MDAIRTEQLTKKYDLGWRKGKLLALEKLNLGVREGEVYGLLGVRLSLPFIGNHDGGCGHTDGGREGTESSQTCIRLIDLYILWRVRGQLCVQRVRVDEAVRDSDVEQSRLDDDESTPEVTQ